jgi:hypothetical protein
VTARLVLVASVIGGQADIKVADELGGQKAADVLAAWTAQNRSEREATA